MIDLKSNDDWAVVRSFLPDDWEKQCKERGALRRHRNFADPESLLRTLLIHLASGASLRETAVTAKVGGLASVSDVALLKRLRASGDWLRWLAEGIMKNWVHMQPEMVFGSKRRIRLVDGTMIAEPGPTGSSWRIHYSLELPSLRCDQAEVTSKRVGKSFKSFAIQKGDLLVGDQAYGVASSIGHTVRCGGDVLVRINWRNTPLKTQEGYPFQLLRHLRQLSGTKPGDWDVVVTHDGRDIPGRVCAVKMSAPAAERARKKAIRAGQKHGYVPSAQTLEASGYVLVYTTVPRSELSAIKALELYRGRWQIELAFKRLKSIMALGHLHKTSPEGIKAWLQGKLLVAFLVEAMLAAGESFFPWGYPLHQEERA